MAKPHTGVNTNRFEARATAESHFAWLRTRLAVERTMMAWLRTAVALIGFGFTIVQFFDRFEQLPGTSPALFPTAPRYLGLSLIACGVLALTASIWQYWWINSLLVEWWFRNSRWSRGWDKENTALSGF